MPIRHGLPWLTSMHGCCKHACLLYSLELRRKVKNFKLVFLDTGKILLKNFNVVRITAERVLLRYITQPSSLFEVPDFEWKTIFFD